MNDAVRAVVAAVILSALMNFGLAADPLEPVVLKGHTKLVSTVAWAADGQFVVTAGDDRTIRAWDPATGRQAASLPGIAREESAAARRTPSIHGAPKSSNGDAVPRPTETFVGSRSATPG